MITLPNQIMLLQVTKKHACLLHYLGKTLAGFDIKFPSGKTVLIC